MKKEKKNVIFPKDFFTKSRPHVTTKELPEDIIPFKWSDDVLAFRNSIIKFYLKNTYTLEVCVFFVV